MKQTANKSHRDTMSKQMVYTHQTIKEKTVGGVKNIIC